MGRGRYGKSRLTRRSKMQGQVDRLKMRIENAPRDGWGKDRGYTMPGSRKS